MKRNFKWGSVVTGIGLGLLLGYWLNLILEPNIIPYQILVLSGVGVLFFGSLGYNTKTQKFTEIVGYAVSIYILLQYGWDYAVGDQGPIRYGLFIRAIILLGLNSLTGHYGLSKPIKIFWSALGISK